MFALKWSDIDFHNNDISITRSMDMQVVGPCKNEASQRPIPLEPHLAAWLQQSSSPSALRNESDPPAPPFKRYIIGACLEDDRGRLRKFSIRTGIADFSIVVRKLSARA
jgi:hypothetical protein